MVYGSDVVALRVEDDLRIVELADGTTLTTRTVVVATGVAYRMLDAPSLQAFNGVGVHYGSAMSEARALAGEHACRRRWRQLGRPSCDAPRTVRRVRDNRRAIGHPRGEHVRLPRQEHRPDAEHQHPLRDGRRRRWRRRSPRMARPQGPQDRGDRNVSRSRRCSSSSAPTRAPTGFQLQSSVTPGATSRRVDTASAMSISTSGRAPLMFETTLPGVFAVGDVRQGSVKRVASAAGEGAVCVRLIHDYLDEQSLPRDPRMAVKRS